MDRAVALHVPMSSLGAGTRTVPGDLLAEFLAETEDALGKIDTALRGLARDPLDREPLDAAFHLLHTVKGLSGFLGFDRLGRLTHAAEDVLGQVRDGARPADGPARDALQAAVARLKAIVRAIGAAGREPDGDDNDLIEGLPAPAGGIRRMQPHRILPDRRPPPGSTRAMLAHFVRDLAREQGKEAELVVSDDAAALNGAVPAGILGLLVHLLRNAVDHGIEAPAMRHTAGKPAIGHISLSARHDGNALVVDVADDGCGLPPARLRAEARRRGLVPAAALDAMSDDAVRALIFRPGFSTAPTVTPLSGRGVGMAAVRARLDAIGGTVEVRSDEGLGTRFTLRFPRATPIKTRD